MTEPWWERGGFTPAVDDAGAPIAVPGDASSERALLLERARAFTPDWRPALDDPGSTIATIGAELFELLRQRANRLPEKTNVELLDAAGYSARPASPATTVLELTLSRAASRPVSIPSGFRVGAQAGSETITFETERALDAFPGDVVEAHVEDGAGARDVTSIATGGESETFRRSSAPGDALLLALSGDVAPGPTVSLFVNVVPPAGEQWASDALGAPMSITPRPLLAWEAFDGGAWTSMPVVTDETDALRVPGVVVLRAPARWRPDRPSVLTQGAIWRFLRVRLSSGKIAASVRIAGVRANCVRAKGVRTVRDEVLEPIDGLVRRKFELARSPVEAGSLVLEVDDGRQTRRWREMPSLALADPDDEVFTLDEATGGIGFGDGRHGAVLPEGFRNVVARSYRVVLDPSAPIPAGAATALLASAPFVIKVGNPIAASGGRSGDTVAAALRNAPAFLRSGGRAVAASDYEVLARNAPGARVERAYCIPGRHPAHPGATLAGVVGLVVVPPDARDGTPPVPTPDEMSRVARYLAREAGPAGVEVLVIAPRYVRVRLDFSLVIDRALDASATVRAVLDAVDAWLHPLSGGDHGDGFRPGDLLRHASLLRRIFTVAGVRAVPQLGVLLDGRRSPGCDRHPLADGSLPWPDAHDVSARFEGESA